jgi:hypothetical protein
LLNALSGVQRAKEAEYSGWRDGAVQARIRVAYDAGSVVPGGVEPLDELFLLFGLPLTPGEKR